MGGIVLERAGGLLLRLPLGITDGAKDVLLLGADGGSNDATAGGPIVDVLDGFVEGITLGNNGGSLVRYSLEVLLSAKMVRKMNFHLEMELQKLPLSVSWVVS